jgi:hypothetical protein
MKKVFWLIVFFTALNFSFSFGQINYEATYNNYIVLKYFNHTSPKWMTRPTTNDVYLYNLNHSLYRHIVIPAQSQYFNFCYLTEDLFDTDSTNFEYLLSIGNFNNTCFVKIYREDGTLLFQRDSALFALTAITANSDYQDNIIVTDSGTKMVLPIQNPSNSRTEIYLLPGHLPCKMTCSEHVVSEGLPTEIKETTQKNFNNPYPNPTSSQIHIPYSIPDGETQGEIIFYDMAGAEVKRFKVDRTFSDLILSTTDLTAGSYYYQLITAHSKSEGKKLIVIK